MTLFKILNKIFYEFSQFVIIVTISVLKIVYNIMIIKRNIITIIGG